MVAQSAAAEHLHLVAGIPSRSDGPQQNYAVVFDPDGKLLTRHAQIVVDGRDLFVPGIAICSMRLRVKRVPSVVTIGPREALWNENGRGWSRVAPWESAAENRRGPRTSFRYGKA